MTDSLYSNHPRPSPLSGKTNAYTDPRTLRTPRGMVDCASTLLSTVRSPTNIAPSAVRVKLRWWLSRHRRATPDDGRDRPSAPQRCFARLSLSMHRSRHAVERRPPRRELETLADDGAGNTPDGIRTRDLRRTKPALLEACPRGTLAAIELRAHIDLIVTSPCCGVSETRSVSDQGGSDSVGAPCRVQNSARISAFLSVLALADEKRTQRSTRIGDPNARRCSSDRLSLKTRQLDAGRVAAVKQVEPMTERTVAEKLAEPVHSASVVEAFERCVDAGPDRHAVRCPGREASRDISFGQLENWANAIASELLARRGSGPEPVPLAVCAPDLMLAAALGVLKAGKFYVAVDPMYPARHVQRVLEELGAPLMLCDRRGEAAARHRVPRALVEEILVARASDGRPELRFDERRLAYVLYTSGSTGRPRGVAQSRRDMLHNVARHRPLRIGRVDCVTLISADGFVASVSNPYIALLGGAALAPYSFKGSGAEGMIDWLAATGVTVLYAFPSFLRQLAAAEPTRTYDRLRLAYLGGETVLPTDLESARRLFPAAVLATGLNSSETGLTCLHLIPPHSPLPNPVPAGRAVVDIDVRVINESGTALPPGEHGEIEISSAYVRPRYWRRGGVRDRPSPAPAFRTGDRGRIDADGIVYHIGRVDDMLKVRGYRVERAEVEATISRLPGVSEVAVFGAGQAPATELAACVVTPDTGIDATTVRTAVARELPPAMIPTRVLIVDELPRTPNGKLDRKALAQMARVAEPQASSAPTAVNGSAANTNAGGTAHELVQRRINEIWSAELNIDRPPGETDFFALGGNSLTAVSVISRVRSEFGVPVPLAVLFRTPTVGALAAAVIELKDKDALEDGRATPRVAVRPAQERDFPDVCALVNHYIRHTRLNFRTEPQTPDEWIADWSETRTRYPWLVASIDGVLDGVAYAGPWKARTAYDWCAEVTVYVAPSAQRMGLGRTLYEHLLTTLDDQGYRTEVAAIALPNPASIALHETFGFRPAGTLRRVGYKLGAWLDVGFWQRRQPSRGEPPPAPAAVPGE
jgi:acyl-coenzyme A synthetase/AMP-(fatty) acid ligase/L-amino acid N-acyltransferase YncA/acyl carrier protein